MTWTIGMPNLGHTMVEGKVSEWLKNPGDRVRAGDVIAIVESDKAAFDIESPADGMLVAIKVKPGQTVPVGAVIASFAAPAGCWSTTPASCAAARWPKCRSTTGTACSRST